MRYAHFIDLIENLHCTIAISFGLTYLDMRRHACWSIFQHNCISLIIIAWISLLWIRCCNWAWGHAILSRYVISLIIIIAVEFPFILNTYHTKDFMQYNYVISVQNWMFTSLNLWFFWHLAYTCLLCLNVMVYNLRAYFSVNVFHTERSFNVKLNPNFTIIKAFSCIQKKALRRYETHCIKLCKDDINLRIIIIIVFDFPFLYLSINHPLGSRSFLESQKYERFCHRTYCVKSISIIVRQCSRLWV